LRSGTYEITTASFHVLERNSSSRSSMIFTIARRHVSHQETATYAFI
jgi:hypothetical protein